MSALGLGRLSPAALLLHGVIAMAQDHSHHQVPQPAPADEHVWDEDATEDEHATHQASPPALGHTETSEMDHTAMGHTMPASAQPRQPIPALTEVDRQAAFPTVSGHTAHDRQPMSFVQFNRVEAWDGDEGTGLLWDARAWIGYDLDKLWLRTEGERIDGSTEHADIELLYGSAIARWWDLVAGVRHDVEPGESQSWVALGVIGLAPQKFEVEATAYVRDSGRTAGRLEVEYELLLTNRLIAQPLIELQVLGKDDPERAQAAGFTTVEAGLRLRYEFNRKLAPYVGIVYERALGDTADLRRLDGEDVDDTRVVAGLRVWF
jgi:copper resistance protein B